MTVMAKALPCFAIISSVWAQAAAPADGWQERVNDEGRKVQSLQISAPSMTEEDQYGYVMPDRYRCDSCKVVVYHLSEALLQGQPKKRELRESELDELFQGTCKNAFKGYGISLIDGENALSGPALQRSEVTPGNGAIQMGGETWELRLGEICRKFVYDKVGEDELYQHFRAGGKISEELCVSQTHDCQAPGKTEVKPKKQKGDKREKKPKKETSEKAWEAKEEQVSGGSKSAEEAGFASDEEVRKLLRARGGEVQEQRHGSREQKRDTKEEDEVHKSKMEAAWLSKQQQKSKKETVVQSQKSKADPSREAREQKLKRDVQKQVEAAAASIESDQDHLLDAEAFFKQLAMDHNLPANEYTRKRTTKEWEQVLMRAAGRIYERRDMDASVQV